jgi:hypothetical protein
MADMLDDLRQLRERSDYELGTKLTNNELSAAIKLADYIWPRLT